MAYGMSSSELARVGKNVNEQGQGVDEQSIQTAMDRELDEDRKEQVGRFKKRKQSARDVDAQQKAELKANLTKAVVSSAIKAGAHAADAKAEGGDNPRSERVARRAERAGKRGNLVKQARLQDRSAMLKGKEDIRAAAQQTKLNQKLSGQKAAATKRANDPKMKERLDKYKLKKLDKKHRAVRDPKSDVKILGGPGLPGKQVVVGSRGTGQSGKIYTDPGGTGKPLHGYELFTNEVDKLNARNMRKR